MSLVLNKQTDAIPEDAIYVGRPGMWGNPFPLQKETDRHGCIYRYIGYLQSNPRLVAEAKEKLKNRKLVCYCHPLVCHGHVLAIVANTDIDLSYIALNIPALTRMVDEITNTDRGVRLKSASSSKPKRSALATQKIIPLEDGITHINAYSHGRTRLGRELSHFAEIGLVHPEHGHFASLESFYYWNKTGRQFNSLRSLSGYAVKKLGLKLPIIHRESFLREIEEAVELKITQNPDLLARFKESSLFVTHYYTAGLGLDCKAIHTKTTKWFEVYYNGLRDKLNGTVYPEPDYSELDDVVF